MCGMLKSMHYITAGINIVNLKMIRSDKGFFRRARAVLKLTEMLMLLNKSHFLNPCPPQCIMRTN